MSSRPPIPFHRTALRCLAVVLAANAVFLLVRLGDSALPRTVIQQRLAAAVANGSLGTISYPSNLMLGADQYTDFVSMQILVLGSTTVWTNALAPRIASPEGAGLKGTHFPDRGGELQAAVRGELPLERTATYTRFWHGQSTVLGLGLFFLSLDGYRALLLLLTLALIAVAAVAAALQGSRLLLRLSPLLLVSFLLCGQTHFGQLISYGPSQIVCWSVACLLIVCRQRLTWEGALLLATAAGAMEAFLDMMLGIPLVAGVFLVVAGTVLVSWTDSVRSAAGKMLGLGAAWSFGFVVTYASKLGVTCVLLGWREVILPFVTQLQYRAGLVHLPGALPKGVSWLGMIPQNLDALATNIWRLGYTTGDVDSSARLIIWLALAGWLYALARLVIASRHSRARGVIVASVGYLAAAAFVFAWVAIFPEHTWTHAWIMTRAAALWIAGGWGVAMTDLALRRRGNDATEKPEAGSS